MNHGKVINESIWVISVLKIVFHWGHHKERTLLINNVWNLFFAFWMYPVFWCLAKRITLQPQTSLFKNFSSLWSFIWFVSRKLVLSVLLCMNSWLIISFQYCPPHMEKMLKSKNFFSCQLFTTVDNKIITTPCDTNFQSVIWLGEETVLLFHPVMMKKKK